MQNINQTTNISKEQAVALKQSFPKEYIMIKESDGVKEVFKLVRLADYKDWTLI